MYGTGRTLHDTQMPLECEASHGMEPRTQEYLQKKLRHRRGHGGKRSADLQAVLIEGGEIDGLVAELVVELAAELERESAQHQLRRQAVDQQLVQLPAHLVQPLRRLLLQDERRYLLRAQGGVGRMARWCISDLTQR